MRYFLLIVLAIVLASCAGIKPPPGGPEDIKPPTIDTTMPANGSLNVPLDTKIHIFFQQNVDRQSFTSSVSMTPYLNGVVKYDWSGYDEVTINLPEKLRPNTTYVLTFGKDLKTKRAGKLTTPIQIIFSTGSSIDSGSIKGKILPSFKAPTSEISNNVFVFAYDITNLIPDTLELSHNKPDFLVQPSADATFEFKALKVGHTYRVIAVQDEFRNKLYDHTIDGFGVAKEDIKLASGTGNTVRIRMAMKFDTTKPTLQDVEIIDLHHVKASFSKPLDSLSIEEPNFRIAPQAGGTELVMGAAYRENVDKRPGIVTIVSLDAIKPNTPYIFIASTAAISDQRGNHLSDSGASYIFTSPEKIIDTFPVPRFSGFPIADSSRDVDPLLNFRISTTGAIVTTFLDSALILKDSIGKRIPINIIHVDGTHSIIRSKDTLSPRVRYTLTLDNKQVVSILANNRPQKDTTFTLRFWVGDIEETGTITGTVTFDDAIYSAADFRVVVELINLGTGEKIRKPLSEGRNVFSFARLQRGKYRIRGFLSDNDFNFFNTGTVQPFRFAMPSGDYPEEIDVRPRWTVDNVNFDLK